MNNKKSFVDKLTSFIFGEPIPVLSENDLQTIHTLDQKLDSLLTLLDRNQTGLQQARVPLTERDQIEPHSSASRVGVAEPAQIQRGLEDLTEQVRKLAKTQFKTNTLQESQLTQQQESLESLQKSIDQQEKFLTDLTQQREQATEAAQLEVFKSLLPALDALDAAFDSGRRQVLQLPMRPEVRQAVIAWLDGIRLARMRLLDVLAAHDITPIPTIGQPFDPHRHVAVATDTSRGMPEGTIVSEDRRGYATATKVLREAEVVVARSR